jgi:hypothetical protein
MARFVEFENDFDYPFLPAKYAVNVREVRYQRPILL